LSNILHRNLSSFITEILKLYEKFGIKVETEGRSAFRVELKNKVPAK